MTVVVNTNVSSINAQRHLNYNSMQLNRAMERLASGYRINRAGDDAAGLFVSENLRTQIRGSKKALDNTQDGINMLNIADGAFQTISDNLQRMRELVVQAGNETYGQPQRTALNIEIDQLRADIDRISSTTQFNGTILLSTAPASYNLQVGANGTANDVISLLAAMGDTRATAAAGLNIVTAASATIVDNATARTYLGTIDAALVILNTRRANLGAVVNRLEGTAKNLSNSIENMSSAESRIRDTDIAAESAEMSRYQVLQQSSAAILAQANQSTSIALKVLGN